MAEFPRYSKSPGNGAFSFSYMGARSGSARVSYGWRFARLAATVGLLETTYRRASC